MNTLEKLVVIQKVLGANPTYNLENNIKGLIKYIATAIQSDYNRYSLITNLGILSKDSIIRKKNSINVQEAINIILTTPHLNWDAPEIGYTKYVSYALDQEFEKISPIEWAKLLNFAYTYNYPSITKLD